MVVDLLIAPHVGEEANKCAGLAVVAGVRQEHDYSTGRDRTVGCYNCTNGYIRCSDCWGKGHVRCGTCDGDGVLICKHCEGSGNVIIFFIVAKDTFVSADNNTIVNHSFLPLEIINGDNIHIYTIGSKKTNTTENIKSENGLLMCNLFYTGKIPL